MRKVPQSVLDEFKKLEQMLGDTAADKLLDREFLIDLCKNDRRFENLGAYIEEHLNSYLENVAKEYWFPLMDEQLTKATKDLPEELQWKNLKDT